MSRSWIVTHTRGLVTREGRVLLEEHEVRALGIDASRARPLAAPGVDAALLAHAEADVEAQGFAVSGLRALLGALGREELGAAMRAVQVRAFLDTHRFCGRCAAELEDVSRELARRCPRCELTVYPRLAPAVIVLVRRGRQALLARSTRFPLPFFSTLAGFVEVGETLEDAVHRELREEVSVEVDRVRYFGSQPWPFPHSLMVGFTAEWVSGELRPDAEEIAEARFFDADDLPKVPPRFSIARRLIDAWVEEVLGAPSSSE